MNENTKYFLFNFKGHFKLLLLPVLIILINTIIPYIIISILLSVIIWILFLIAITEIPKKEEKEDK
jgi:ABC-type transport system involved in multi-copper enzyme maturation permease subunit